MVEVGKTYEIRTPDGNSGVYINEVKVLDIKNSRVKVLWLVSQHWSWLELDCIDVVKEIQK